MVKPRWRPRWRPLLVTSQASSGATTHKIYLILLRRSKAFHYLKVKSFRNTAICQKLRGRLPSIPTSPLYHGRGMNLRVNRLVFTGNYMRMVTFLFPVSLLFRMKQDRLRREMQEKYERSLFMPKGLKTFRLQPSIDNTSLLKVSCCLILLYLQSRNLT